MMKKSLLLEVGITIYEELIDGSSDDDIMSVHGLDEETFRAAKKLMLDNKAAELRDKSREQVYVEYCMEQDHTMRAIDTLLNGLDAARQYNAVVGALRLRSEIVDKKINKGFEFGIIRKEPDRRELIGGVVITDLSDDELKKRIVATVAATKELVSKFGDKDMLALPPRSMYYGSAAIIDAKCEPTKETPPEPLTRPVKKKRIGGTKVTRR